MALHAVAIVFMHAYRYPAHEQQVAALARELGFAQVSASHEVSPLMKLVSRGDTTVVDAYLSPILRGYVARVAGELQGGASDHLSPRAGRGRLPSDARKPGEGAFPRAQTAGEAPSPGSAGRAGLATLSPQAGRGEPRLMFMMSSGGLTAADLFQGKDAILSGPAGGVVGMAETGRAAGFNDLIGFDMGGTSTDVSHFDGEYERAFETEVAGVRMRAPMMLIHTVAAGGGSILHFDGARFRVGPELSRRQSRPGLLSPRRPACGDRRQCHGRQTHPGFLSENFRPCAEAATRRRRRARGLCGARCRSRRRPHR